MIEFLQEAFLRNHWLWFHCLGAMLLFKFWDSLKVVLLIGVAWELFELFYDGWEVYGSVFDYAADTFGDLIIIPIVWVIHKIH